MINLTYENLRVTSIFPHFNFFEQLEFHIHSADHEKQVL